MAKKAQESQYVSDTFVRTLWDQFEEAVSRTREVREQQRTAFLNAMKETLKFNEVTRNTLKTIFEETNKTNKELVSEIANSNTGLANNTEVTERFRPVLDQWNGVASRFNELATTPVKASFDILEGIEKQLEKSTESYISYAKQTQESWDSVADEYIKVSRNYHEDFAHRLEDSYRTLTASAK